MSEPIKLPPIEIFDKGPWAWKGQEFTGAELDAVAFAKYRLAVEQNTAELLRELTTLHRWYADVSMRAEKAEAEVERLRAELARLTRPNLFWVSGGEGAACEELGEMAERISEEFWGDNRDFTATIDCARTLPSVQMRVWINDEGGVDFECPILDVKEPK